MPSMNIQIIALTVVFWITYIHKTDHSFTDIFRIAMLVGILIATAYQRVIICCESWFQVITGGSIGTLCGVLFFFLGEKFGVIDIETLKQHTNDNNLANHKLYNSMLNKF